MSLIKNKKGFTIIELLIVMGIIAVLVALSIAGLGIAQRQSRTTTRLNDADTLRTAIEEYRSVVGSYPAPTSVTVTGTTINITGSGNYPTRSLTVQSTGLAFSTATTNACPAATGSSWNILYNTTTTGFDLYVCHENGKSQNLGGY